VNVRRSIAVACVLLAAPALSSCGVSFGAQTDQIYNPTTGVDNRTGEVDVLNALIVSGSDGSGTVVAGLVNNDPRNDDTLTDVGPGKPGKQDITGTVNPPDTIKARGLLNLAQDGNVTVTGPTIKPGVFIPLTFTFAHAAAITVNVPVVSGSDPVYSSVPLPSAS
jgi:hypothetical protein